MSRQFDQRFTDALERMIPKSHDDYEEIKYSDSIYAHVWSADEGEDAFEIEAIVPHDSVGAGVDVESAAFSDVVPEASGFYDDIERLIEEVTGEDFSEVVLHLTSVVDDGAWERDASVYSTFTLTI